jgi:hypothetical protein
MEEKREYIKNNASNSFELDFDGSIVLDIA